MRVSFVVNSLTTTLRYSTVLERLICGEEVKDLQQGFLAL
jgi:hypothetical protein